MAELDSLGVGLVVLDSAIDTSTASGRLLLGVIGAVAEFERELLRERTRAGLRAARRRGVRLGGRQPKLTRSGVERVKRLRRSGHSLRAIAEKLAISLGTAHAAVHGTAKVRKA